MRPQSRQLGFGGAGSLCSAIAGVGTDGSVRHGCPKTLSHALKMGCPFHVHGNHGLNLPTFLSNATGPSSHSKGSPRGTAERHCCLATMETERARRGWVSNKIQKVESGEHRVVVGIKRASGHTVQAVVAKATPVSQAAEINLRVCSPANESAAMPVS